MNTKWIWVVLLALLSVQAHANLQLNFPASRLGTGPFNVVHNISADAVVQIDGVDQPGRLAANSVFQGGSPTTVSLVWAYDIVFEERIVEEGAAVTLRDIQVMLTCPEGFPQLSFARGENNQYPYQIGVPFPTNLPTFMPVFALLECLAPPVCELSSASLDFGTPEPGTPVERSLTITNAGGGLLVGDVTAGCPAFRVDNGVYSLGIGQSQTVRVILLSETPGAFTCTLDAGGECEDLILTGTVIHTPTCGVSVGSLDFGTTRENMPVERSFLLTNTGTNVLTGQVTEGCAAFSVSNGSYNLDIGQSQTVSVTLLSATPGSYSCTLDTGGECQDIPLTGTVIHVPPCGVSVGNLDFDTTVVGVPVMRSFTLSNTGTSPLTGEVTEDCEAFSVSNGSYNLDIGQSQIVSVTLHATTAGSFSCTLDTGGECQDISLAGVVDLAPVCEVSESSLDFGTVGPNTPVSRSFTIRNLGGGMLSGSVTEACNTMTVTNGSYNLGAGQSRTVTVTFQSAAAGTYLCTLDTGGDCADIILSGAVVLPPTCQLSTTYLEFGAVLPNVPVTRTFSITNVGGGTLSGVATETCDVFSVFNASYSLGPGQSQTIAVTLLAPSTGNYLCTLNPGSSCDNISLSSEYVTSDVVWSECFCQIPDPQFPNYFEFPAVGDPALVHVYHLMRLSGMGDVPTYMQSPAQYNNDGMQLDMTFQFAVSECATALGYYITPAALTAAPATPVLPEGLSFVIERSGTVASISVYDDGALVTVAALPIYDSNMHQLRVRFDEFNQKVRIDLFEMLSEVNVLPWTTVSGPSTAWVGFGGFASRGCFQYIDDICMSVRDDNGYEVIGEDEPETFSLSQNVPNPFNPSTTITFHMPETGPASLRVYNLSGQLVATLVDGMRERGAQNVVFDGLGLSSGVYFYTLETAGSSETHRMVLLK